MFYTGFCTVSKSRVVVSVCEGLASRRGVGGRGVRLHGGVPPRRPPAGVAQARHGGAGAHAAVERLFSGAEGLAPLRHLQLQQTTKEQFEGLPGCPLRRTSSRQLQAPPAYELFDTICYSAPICCLN
ncbi:hypothetical protein FOCC_FOCC003843 [Frankliniella occidentalis]|nr:hypothetical protein FOCC_FOCC003843 [Frankliniella occidentalis]